MLRKTAIASIVLLISTVAMAQPPMDFIGAYQTQNLVGAITNTVAIEHGDTGKNIVSVDIKNSQAVDNVHHLYAEQGQDAFLMQVGQACADCGIVQVGQELGTVGVQVQAIGSGIAPKQQAQGLGLVGNQLVAKSDGQGGGMAFQVGDVKSSQYGENAAGWVDQSSKINSFQDSTYNGAAGNVGLVTSSVTAETSQTQMVSN
jgi:hypothetical protein